MKISEDTQNVINFLDEFSPDGLRKRNDLAVILEITAQMNDYALANKIIFTGKSVYNLNRKFKKTQGTGADLLQNQLLKSLDELVELLQKVIQNCNDEELKKRFEVTYFANSNGSLANLIDLAYDLSILKDVQMRRDEFLKQENDDL
jgi:hypothetical protein